MTTTMTSEFEEAAPLQLIKYTKVNKHAEKKEKNSYITQFVHPVDLQIWWFVKLELQQKQTDV